MAGIAITRRDLTAEQLRAAYLRQNKLAITVFDDYDHILEKSCAAWNFFAAGKAAIASITTRSWAKVTL